MSSIWDPAGAERDVRPSFDGPAGAMFPIVLKGLALTILTLGVYRFWYVTNVRRFLWNRVEVDGDYLEYTGRGVELFIGFLIALAVIAPLYGLLFLLGAMLGPIGGLVAQNAATVVIIFLAQFALFRARRYRLTRTIWRGVRFQQSGSGLAYAARSLGWAILAIATLGLAYPWMRANLERYKMTNTWYGDQQGAFSATGGQLFRKGFLLWLLAAIVLVGPIGVVAAIEAATPGALKASPGYGSIMLLLALLPVILVIYFAVEYRWWANGCSIGAASARCDLGTFQFLKVYAGFAGVAILFALAAMLVLGMAGAALYGGGIFATAEPGPAHYAVIAGGVLLYFAGAMAFAALWQLFGVRPLWRKSFESVAIAGLPALAAAQSQTPAANAFGEGIADAIDFGGF